MSVAGGVLGCQMCGAPAGHPCDCVGGGDMIDYPLFWRVKVIRPEWFGRRCRIVIHGGKGNRLIEFENGERVVCPGTYLRRATVGTPIKR